MDINNTTVAMKTAVVMVIASLCVSKLNENKDTFKELSFTHFTLTCCTYGYMEKNS